MQQGGLPPIEALPRLHSSGWLAGSPRQRPAATKRAGSPAYWYTVNPGQHSRRGQQGSSEYDCAAASASIQAIQLVLQKSGCSKQAKHAASAQHKVCMQLSAHTIQADVMPYFLVLPPRDE